LTSPDIARVGLIPRRSYQAIVFRRSALFPKAENEMSDLFVIKQMEGYNAKFLRFAGPDNFVIEVNGVERTVTREFWRRSPNLDPSNVNAPSK